MMLFFWIVLILIVSVILAYWSLKKERQRHEIDTAKKEMSTGRVIFHSSAEELQED